MAKYTNITKPQVMAIRNLLVLLSQQQQQKQSSTTTTTTTDADDRPIMMMMIQRKQLLKAIQKVNLAKDPDHDIIDLIFTMWCQYEHVNTNETNDIDPTRSTPQQQQQQRSSTSSSKAAVPWYEFLISLSLLACKTDTFEQSIRFTLYVVHRNHFYHTTTTTNLPSQQGYISSTDAISFLQGTLLFDTRCFFFIDLYDVSLKNLIRR